MSRSRILAFAVGVAMLVALSVPAMASAISSPTPSVTVYGAVVTYANTASVSYGGKTYAARGFIFRKYVKSGYIHWFGVALSGKTSIQHRQPDGTYKAATTSAITAGHKANLTASPVGKVWVTISGKRVYIPWMSRVVLY